jgi:hypothetical protein
MLPFVKPGGMYIIEDLHTVYFNMFGGWRQGRLGITLLLPTKDIGNNWFGLVPKSESWE